MARCARLWPGLTSPHSEKGPRSPAMQPRLERPLSTTALTSAGAGAVAGDDGTGFCPAQPPSSFAA